MANAIYNSNLSIAAGQGVIGVYPISVFGSVVIVSNTTLSTTDVINLCAIPGNGILDDFTIALPAIDGGSGLTLSLQDTTGTPMVYISSTTKGQAAGVLTWNDYYVTSGGLGNLYTNQSTLVLKPTHVATNTSGATALTIEFRVKFKAQ
jgi:hypothetical protein